MKSAIHFVLLAAGFLLVVGCTSNSTASNDVVARVNGNEITAAELEKQFEARISGAEQAPSAEEAQALKFQFLGQMITDRILVDRATSSGLAATDAEVDTKFTEFRTQYTEEQFSEVLKKQKLTADDIKAEMRKTLTIEKLVTKEITSRVKVSDAEIKDFYEKNKESFNLPEGFRLSHIMVTPVPEAQITNAKKDDAKTPAEALAKANRLLHEVQGGLDFGVVARDWSEDADSAPNGGDWNFRSLTDIAGINPKLAQAAQRLRVGETSPLIETQYGYHLLKLVDRDPGGQKELANPQVQAQIRQMIFNRKEEMLRAAFSETARNKAQVANYFAERLWENAGKEAAAAPAPAEAPAAEKK